MQAEKRAHHNALERKRRDHIKDSFTSLRESVPALQNEKVVSVCKYLCKTLISWLPEILKNPIYYITNLVFLDYLFLLNVF